MHIDTIISQHRRDIWAIFKCEHCGAIERKKGYDDNNYHRHVVPAMLCKECGKAASSDYKPRQPKYAEHERV